MRSISLHAVPFDTPDARALINEFYQEQLTRYERADPPNDDPRDYAPPQGLFLLLYVDGEPAGCGGYRAYDDSTGEIKRLYVRAIYRGQGYGRRILAELEDHGRAVGATSLLLETGVHNCAAIALFVTANYATISSYVPRRNQRINRAFAKNLSVLSTYPEQAPTTRSISP